MKKAPSSNKRKAPAKQPKAQSKVAPKMEMPEENGAEVSSTTIDQLYQSACRLYQEKKYGESATIFILLTTLNPHAHRFWIGLGLSEQQNRQFESALVAYDMATWANNDDPAPYVYAADCYLSLKGEMLALESLEKALKLAGKREEYKSLREEALKRKELIQSTSTL